ncbi:glycerophosphoryl diester phosphodiesterase family protein [Sodiomyces alkalinus F11]|uniref:Glycerophosphoryl diester phosphodiesterase family protein n=1 Tax=Sodiomyces alkalinus (strain CBS 110278 / VKM F-3762 / F11) TaxID=1314773 RepID=A0A3N2PLV6_SODAK|nr:glycerophosphoryl diester phosphodiesterase family protein [Sodiomyces alkalinus F11]ROT35502.1 glycerophosphoryl diester phosphodiesterase family protein [Sodiomyces alkalinus F11]
MTVSDTDPLLLKRPHPPIQPGKAPLSPLFDSCKDLHRLIPITAPWTKAHLSPTPDDPKRRLPQAIAHRGFKALYPENTMAAFTAAVAAGTHAIETDLHLSSDGVVVISHDPSLKRCYGVDKLPHEPIPRFVHLLNFLARPEYAHVWLLLDLKLTNTADELFAAMSRDLEAVSPPKDMPWDKRVVMGCWNQPFLNASLSVLPTYSTAHISFSPLDSSRFLRDPAYAGLSFALLQPTLVGPWASRFLRAVRAAPDAHSRQFFVWTVNEVEWMDWAIRTGVDGVITDDPATFLQVRSRYEVDGRANATRRQQVTDDSPESFLAVVPPPTSWGRWARLYLRVVTVQLLFTVLAPFFLRSKRFKFTKMGN